MLITSLLAVYIAITDYHDVLKKSVYLTEKTRVARDSKRVFSSELYALSNAVDEALNRIFIGYGDVIPSFSFPDIYAKDIQRRLNRVVSL